MSSSARILPAAERDIDEHFLYIVTDDINAAFRFLESIRHTIAVLTDVPDMGTLWGFERSDLSDIRVWPVRRFRNHLVFYREIADGIEVVRVLHGARDIEAIFESPSA